MLVVSLFDKVFVEDQLTGASPNGGQPVRILSGLSKRTLKQLRRLANKRKKRAKQQLSVADTFPVVNRDMPTFSVPMGALNGPPGFGPVSVGRARPF